MVYLRGAASDYDESGQRGRRRLELPGGPADFRRSEDNERGADTYHGAGGPLSVSDGRSRHPLSAAFLRAAQQAGYPLNEDLNGASQDGVWLHPGDAAIRPALQRLRAHTSDHAAPAQPHPGRRGAGD